MNRALRFTQTPTKLSRDAQLSRESKTRLIRFKLRRTHQHYAQLAVRWAAAIATKEATN